MGTTTNSSDRRILSIGEVDIPINAARLPALYRARVIYDCGTDHGGPEHDLHIDPAESFCLDQMELLALAIHEAK